MTEGPTKGSGRLEDFRPPTKLRLAALWTSVMFLYVYGDYFNLYMPGKLEAIGAGRIGSFGEAGAAVFVGVAAMMAVPSLMIFVSLAAAPWLARLLNVIFGLAYSAILALTMPGAAPFYLFYGVIEIALTLLIAWTALVWPRAPRADAAGNAR